jgi:uncharacterized protein (DUF2384 family)
MRSEQLIRLRSTMPVQLVTLHHDIPKHVTAPVPDEEFDRLAAELLRPADEEMTTPKVPRAHAGRRETTARKGGEAR